MSVFCVVIFGMNRATRSLTSRCDQ